MFRPIPLQMLAGLADAGFSLADSQFRPDRMTYLTQDEMEGYLSRSLSSVNANKLNGLLAEIAFRDYVQQLGFGGRVSAGGWLFRTSYNGRFGLHNFVCFPETIQLGVEYPGPVPFNNPAVGLHAVGTHFHQAGISAFACSPVIDRTRDPIAIQWHAWRLGLPGPGAWQPLVQILPRLLNPRQRPYKFLRYNSDAGLIPPQELATEFTKENLRVSVQSDYYAEVSDVDGVFYGQQLAYPVEIKEKTVASDRSVGPYFGLDVGPFTKLAFYAARQGNLSSLFVVREIDNVVDRNLVDWWMIKFSELAQAASWVPRGGGRAMGGGHSSVVLVPRAAFQPMNAASLGEL